jgi:hypothetical protein
VFVSDEDENKQPRRHWPKKEKARGQKQALQPRRVGPTLARRTFHASEGGGRNDISDFRLDSFCDLHLGAPGDLGGQGRVVGIPDGILAVHHWHINCRRRLAR